jgi:pyruvate kinase
MRRAKIVCTIGPAVESVEKIAELVDAGMNMARLNLSHGDHTEHQLRLEMVRTAAKKANKPVAVLVDLQGPKIRLARFATGPHELARGDTFTITTDDVDGTKERVGTTYKGLPGDCKAGDYILIDDGKVTVQVTKVSGNDVITTVIQPGQVSNNKGLNLPGVAVSVPALSEKDKADLRWGLKAGADFIALSFVRSAADLKDVHAIMDEVGVRIPVIAKIEKPEGVANIDKIVAYCDGLMVARGDLGVEVPAHEVPLIQKKLVNRAKTARIPVIIATQMMETMITSLTPTRAEVNDVANLSFSVPGHLTFLAI